jgi:hypothetical protein
MRFNAGDMNAQETARKAWWHGKGDLDSWLNDSLSRERLWEASERVTEEFISPDLVLRFLRHEGRRLSEERAGEWANQSAPTDETARLAALDILSHARAYITERGAR